MDVFHVVVNAIARMRCVVCAQVMNQGERDRNPYTPEGQPVHQTCLDAQAANAAVPLKPVTDNQ